MKGLKFIYPVFSIQEGCPGPDPRQQAIKQGPGEPEVVLEANVIQAQLQEKVVEFPNLCVPLENWWT